MRYRKDRMAKATNYMRMRCPACRDGGFETHIWMGDECGWEHHCPWTKCGFRFLSLWLTRGSNRLTIRIINDGTKGSDRPVL